MISLDDMSVFASVVREGSFTAAARVLGISKQSVSDRISRLEQRLGVRLLERTSRRLRATDAGALYYEHCAAIVAQAKVANEALHDLQREPQGLLRVACTVAFGRVFMVDLAAELLERWPRVRIELMMVDRRVDLIAEGFHVGFWVERPEEGSLVARRVGSAYTCYVASPAYLERHGRPEALAEVTEHACIGWVTTQWRLPGSEPVRIEPRLQLNDPMAALAAARKGVGIARLPGVLVEPGLRDGTLVRLFEGAPARSTDLYAVYPSRRHLSATVRVFLDLVDHRLRESEAS